jgi:hypothetical protein
VRASDFEFRHASLVRHLLIAAAVSAYLFDRDNVIWRFIKESPSRTALEHITFTVVTILIGAGAFLCTRARANNVHNLPKPAESIRRARRSQLLGEFIYAVGLAFLMPLSGCILLICGEGLRVMRLMSRKLEAAEQPVSGWTTAFRREAAKWGILITMILFSVTLIDRLAEYLACVSFIVWAVLNWAAFRAEVSRSTL